MREVGRRREFEDELPARRIPAFELLERVADVRINPRISHAGSASRSSSTIVPKPMSAS
jgi:hypothetical protein